MSIHGRQNFGTNVENKLDDIWKQLIFFKLKSIDWYFMAEDAERYQEKNVWMQSQVG